MTTVGHHEDLYGPTVASLSPFNGYTSGVQVEESQGEMAKKRTDAERRIRQCERLARLLKTLRCISGPGRWDAAGLAAELQCSIRTVHRLLQTLTLAGVPWYFDEGLKSYRVRSGYKFPLIESDPAGTRPGEAELLPREVEHILRKLIADGEAFQSSLGNFLAQVKAVSRRK